MRRTTDILRPCRCITCRQDIHPRAILLAAVILAVAIVAAGQITEWKWIF
ncbi:MAG: hypothetical protein IPL32_20325 [Chloracidobacterium sp.]|nr:hypothetical protein [Chloracidobacterium sp.]MBK8468168.1 hypothetical protein [Chloracidobacterium sp.]